MSLLRTAVLRSLRTRPSPLTARRFPPLVRTVVTKKYTTAHEWVAYDSDTSIGTAGITDYAQSSLGDVVFVELPAPGAELAQGEPLGAVESVKAASDIYAPVTGVVQEVNEELNENPGLLNKSPEERGWLCKIKMSNPAEMDNLLSDEAYKAHCESDEH